ncbi:hypothetical protein Tsp_03024 [Trichinella spiralis]|uniref:hypothetical protein n=1 Tax=Trichinella spiralis TaxID=6334 RepID=UPI0001EFB3FA|nr:hypothetical protein Tsp_03024 [Trichinella spiralis]
MPCVRVCTDSQYSYHMMTSASIFMSLKNECYKCKASTTVLTRLIEISKQYCIVTMFSIICMDMITKTGYATRNILEKFTGEAEQRFQFQIIFIETIRKALRWRGE